MLKQLLEQSSKAPMHFYNEFIMDDRKIMEGKAQKTALSNEDIERYRKNEISNFFNQPKLPELSNILQNIICDSVFNMVQCSKVSDYDLSSLDEQIKKSLYTCKAKTCNNCKNLASNKWIVWNKSFKFQGVKHLFSSDLIIICLTVYTYYNKKIIKFQFGQIKIALKCSYIKLIKCKINTWI